jgi:hypothetical protein
LIDLFRDVGDPFMHLFAMDAIGWHSYRLGWLSVKAGSNYPDCLNATPPDYTAFVVSPREDQHATILRPPELDNRDLPAIDSQLVCIDRVGTTSSAGSIYLEVDEKVPQSPAQRA